jgi:hypothetical protein
MAYGAVARRGGSYRRRSHVHKIRVCVTVTRDIGASNATQYHASAEACTRGYRGKGHTYARGRWGNGTGRTPTAATKKALRAYASKIK